MRFSRRQFMILSAATTSIYVRIANGVDLPSTAPAKPTSGSPPDGVIDAGPIAAFTDDKVYDAYRTQGLFVIRRDKQLFALSSVCTHKGCKVRAGRSIICLQVPRFDL